MPTDCETFYSSTNPPTLAHPTAYAPSYWFATTAPGEPRPDHLDMNCDGTTDLQDVLIILRHIAGVPVTLPAGCEELAPEPDIF